MDVDAMTLWKAWREGRDESARDHIVEQHLPLVHHIARAIRRRLRGDTSIDELVNAGCIGLLHAVESYEPERGTAFSTHAVPRIRGAILDELRRHDVAARSVRKRQRMIAMAEREVAAENGGRADPQETAKRMDIDVETLFRWKSAAKEATHVSLDAPAQGANPDSPTMGEMLPDADSCEVEEQISLEEEKAVMRREFQRLPERERIVLMLYYYEELKLREIAEVLGITESRVSQIRTKALSTLRARMRSLREEV